MAGAIRPDNPRQFAEATGFLQVEAESVGIGDKGFSCPVPLAKLRSISDGLMSSIVGGHTAAHGGLMNRVPFFVASRIWWLLPLMLWVAVVAYSLRSHLEQVRQHSLEIAVESARDMFSMVVLIRAWNAEHGGVYVPVTPQTQPNPYLQHQRRDLLTTDGQQLTMVNPAFMTRQIAEMAAARGGAVFHITSLRPIRPKNVADEWETGALERFDKGEREVFEVVPNKSGDHLLRYMAPLFVEKSCLSCHAQQGYGLGEVRGGISVSLPYGPIAAAAVPAERQGWLRHAIAFVLVAAIGGLLLEMLRRRWINLSDSIGALEGTKKSLQESNRQLVRARDAAESANRAKSTFLANMSHELRTPMNAILGFAYLLRRDARDEHQRDLLHNLDDSARKLLEMIEQVLELAKLEAGTLHLENGRFAMGDLMRDVMGTVEQLARAKGLQCRLEVDPSLPAWLSGDSGRLAEVMKHFADNAVKFSEKGTVTLAVTRQGSDATGVAVRFAVADEGIGIAEEQLPTLFQAFEQVDMSTTRRHGGAGLGLVICRRLAHLMGGDVGVSSVAGQGSLFWLDVVLPMSTAGEMDGAQVVPDAVVQEPHPGGTMSDEDILAEVLYLLAAENPRVQSLWQDNAARLRNLLGGAAGEVEAALAAGDFEKAQSGLCLILESKESDR